MLRSIGKLIKPVAMNIRPFFLLVRRFFKLHLLMNACKKGAVVKSSFSGTPPFRVGGRRIVSGIAHPKGWGTGLFFLFYNNPKKSGAPECKNIFWSIRFPVIIFLLLFFTLIPHSGVYTSHAEENGRLLDSFPWVSTTWDVNELLLSFSNLHPGTFEIYDLDHPSRFVLDIPGLTCPEDEPVFETHNFTGIPILTQLRGRCDAERTRIVLESRYPLHWEVVSPEGSNHLEILFLLRFRQTMEEIAIDSGTTYISRRYVTPSGQRYTHAVISDPSKSRLRPRVLQASDVTGRQMASIDTIVNGCGAAAGINGGYFSWPGISMSLVIQNGEIRCPPQLHRPAFIVLDNGRCMIDYPIIRGSVVSGSGLRLEADVVNQTPGPGQIALLTPGHPARIRNDMDGHFAVFHNGTVEYSGGGDIEDFVDRFVIWSKRYNLYLNLLSIGESVEINYQVTEYGTTRIMHALQGGPFLLNGGRVRVTSEQDDIGRDIAVGRSARTAVGIDNQNRIYLVTVESPASERSIGATLEELAWTLYELGATWAINLDGGSSSGMALGYTDTESGLPAGGRNIVTALVLIDESGRMQGERFFF